MGITIGMLGLRHPHSRAHLRTFDASDRVECVVLCDDDATARDAAAAASRKAAGGCETLEALLAQDAVSVVCVALPTNQVPAAIARCAMAGKHVLCEKPCARNAAEFEPAKSELERAGLQFCVLYPWRRDPAILAMRELVGAGALGRLTSVELRMVTTQVRFRDPSHWLFRGEVAGGGILSWLGCHWLDLLRFLTGEEVESASALLGTLSREAISVEDAAAVSLRLTGGALVTLHAGYLLSSGRAGYEQAGYDMSIVLRGDQGTLHYQAAAKDHVIVLESSAPAWRTAPSQVRRFTLPDVPAYGGAHGLVFVEEFLDATEGRAASPATAQDALRVLEVLDAVYLSASEERVVRLSGQGPA